MILNMKCQLCKRKLTLAQEIAVCKCRGSYCNQHRNDHQCPYNAYEENQKRLRESLKRVEAEKLNRL